MRARPTRRARLRPEAGFSLIELMVVIAIIGILATTVTVSLMSRAEEAKRTRVQADFRNMKDAVSFYKLDTGRYPESMDALVNDPGESGWDGPYIEGGLPTDPWDNPYQMEYPASNEYGYDIVTYGANDSPGGEGEDEDLYMSELLSGGDDRR